MFTLKRFITFIEAWFNCSQFCHTNGSRGLECTAFATFCSSFRGAVSTWEVCWRCQQFPWRLRIHTCILRQLNSRNVPVIANCAYLYSSGCCRLRNALLVKLRTSWDDSATAGNSQQSRFPEYLTVTLSRCVGCQECQQVFLLSGQFLIVAPRTLPWLVSVSSLINLPFRSQTIRFRHCSVCSSICLRFYKWFLLLSFSD
jgi:hypothetical protein